MPTRLTPGRLAGLALLLLTLASTTPCPANVKLPAIFGEHMVLQQDLKLPVWGLADPDEEVTVTLGTETAKTKAGADGKWRVDLKPLPTTTTPLTLTVAGKNTLTLADVLVGEVWICSGQSNMQFGLKGSWRDEARVPKADLSQVRVFQVQSKIADEPQTDVSGRWVLANATPPPDSFTAVGFFFGTELNASLKRPVGLIGNSWGGMPAQAFTSLEALQKDPPFTKYVDAFQKVAADAPKAKEELPAKQAAFTKDLADWNANVGPAFSETMKKWSEDVAKAATDHTPAPPMPKPTVPKPMPPTAPEGAPSTPTVLYNGMVAPLIPYAIRGAIWYQGESNAGAGIEYRTLFPRMITDWRDRWAEGDFPFLFVQLANFQAAQKDPSEGGWALLREAQFMTLKLPNTGMASAIDLGDAGNIHPKDKLDVGLRLAQAAKKAAYGQSVVGSGPLYDKMTVEGNAILLSFTSVGGGLQMSTPPWTPTGAPIPTPTELTGFAIAGSDQKFVWATAKIEGANVIVSSDKVANPVSVRYDWANNPAGNLYNMEGLPASPFRTDTWGDTPAIKPAATAPPAPLKP